MDKDDLEFNKARKEGKGYILIISQGNKGILVSRKLDNLTAVEIEQMIGQMEVTKSELLEIVRELIRKDNERMGVGPR